MSKIGLIRVLTTDDQTLLNAHGAMMEALYPGLHVVSRAIPGHPDGIHDRKTHETAVPLVVEAARAFAEEACQAVVVSCCADPGVPEARAELSIPVIGAGESVGLVARSLGRKVGVVGLEGEVPEPLRETLAGLMAAAEFPKGIDTTLALICETARASVVEAALEAKRKGAEVIALACTGMSTIGIARDIRAAAGVKVVDPVIAAGLFAYHAVMF